MMGSYTTTRYPYTPKRRVVWREICRYLNRHLVDPDARVLELGCGYADFIGNIRARHRVALEIDPSFEKYLKAYGNIAAHFGDALKTLPELTDTFDVVFCSNYFEHFELADVRKQLDMIRNVLSEEGRLIVIQPNYPRCAASYFDDWTHKTIFSHTSFVDLLQAHGFGVDQCVPGFLPFSMRSRLPVSRALVRLYLSSPVKPFAAQFLVVASRGQSWLGGS